MKKQFNSHLYSETKYQFRKDGVHFIEGENHTLFSDMKYPTKIRATDLPEYFIKGRYYKNIGYLDSKNVVDLMYTPFYAFNHCFRDDNLYISYREPIQVKTAKYVGMQDIVGYDYVISGGYILSFLEGVKKFGNVDISKVKEGLLRKIEWFKNHYPDEPECQNIDSIKEKILRL